LPLRSWSAVAVDLVFRDFEDGPLDNIQLWLFSNQTQLMYAYKFDGDTLTTVYNYLKDSRQVFVLDREFQMDDNGTVVGDDNGGT
jgi:hypothetical protein